MKSIRSLSFLKTLLLLAGMSAGFSSLAHAQSYATGKFTLPHDAHWGTTLLTAGDYTFSLESMSFPAMLVVRRADGDLAGVVLSQSITTDTTYDSSKLELKKSGEESFVSSLYIKDLNLMLHYAVPEVAGETSGGMTAKMRPQASAK